MFLKIGAGFVLTVMVFGFALLFGLVQKASQVDYGYTILGVTLMLTFFATTLGFIVAE